MGQVKLGSLSHICLTVRDLAVSVAFYDQVMDFLGYRRSETSDDYVEWDGPAGWFILRPARDGAADRAHDRTSPGLHHLAWRAASRGEVDALGDRLQIMGANQFPYLCSSDREARRSEMSQAMRLGTGWPAAGP